MNTDAEALLSAANFAQLGTLNDDGSPRIDTVWYDYCDAQLRVATTLATRKSKNLLADPRAFAVITARDNPYEQLQLTLQYKAAVPDADLAICDSIAMRYTGREFPQRQHPGRVALMFDIVKARYHKARV